MKFTKEQISLCKQIAKKHKRFPRKGDWEYNDNTKETELKIYEYLGMANPLTGEVNIFLLWTISDCLEFLRERKWRVVQYYNGYGVIRKDKAPDVVSIKLWNWKKELLPEIKGTGKTPLEACLKAVLAVLEEKG